MHRDVLLAKIALTNNLWYEKSKWLQSSKVEWILQSDQMFADEVKTSFLDPLIKGTKYLPLKGEWKEIWKEQAQFP